MADRKPDQPAMSAGCGARGHSLSDHGGGADLDHEHGEDSDHDHDHDFEGALGSVDESLWAQDNVVLHSVGIDIGSAGTQVVFSKIHLQRISDQLSTRYVVLSRDTLYQSPISLTPYQSDTSIDADALGEIIEQAYAASGLNADEVDTGAVILTGEALRRENAQGIAAVLAEQGGEFVCATAGHHMESMLAVYGSGAARRSHDNGSTILNIDIGGGTCKLGLVQAGELQATAAVHLGGRLLVVDEAGRITRLDPAGRGHALRAGFDWQVGSIVQPEQLARVAESMADALIRILHGRYTDSDVDELLLTDPLPALAAVDGIMFSGGVGEYVYGREPRDFGDLGKRFGEAIRARIDAGALPWPLLDAGECIRATVLGASEYSVQLSGNTTFVSAPRVLLPRKNLQVVPLALALDERIDAAQVQAALQRAFLRHDLVEGEQETAVSLRWSGPPAYERLAALAKGLVDALPRSVAAGMALYVIADGDIALTLGHLIQEDARVKGEVLVIDGITLRGFDFVDLGRIRMPSMTVPVTIKSLVFSEDPRSHGKSDPAGWHRHGEGPLHSHANGHAHSHSHDHDHGVPHHHHPPLAPKD
ncbi:MAG: reactivating factor for ethanolamine ammonia lyase [Ramlibacter sp.]|jgi:ethanolamine utilization protein EutA|nr:reactivating factor for ethanolamine ammonia lyase [Ramlibacter sp.]